MQAVPYPEVSWPGSIDIPLKASEEVVSIDLQNDLPEDPGDLRTLLVEENSDKEHWLTIAIAYCNQGKLDECISLIQMALDVFQGPQSSSLHTFLTWAYLKLAKEYSPDSQTRDAHLNKAESHLKDAIVYDPTWIGNMLATIDLYYQQRQYDKALETSDLFVKGIHAEDVRNGRQPKANVMFLLLRAKLLYQKKNYTGCLRLFQELLVLNPMLQPDPRIGIGMCFWQLKDYKMAITSWKRSLEVNPGNSNTNILVLLGEFHSSLSNSEDDDDFKLNYSKALTDLNNIYSDNRENPVLLVLFQSYLYFKGGYQKVIDLYEKRIIVKSQLVADTVLSESAFWCGRAYYSLGEFRKAFLLFQESIKQNEDNLLAKFGLGQTQIQNKLVEEGILTFENLYKTHESIQELNYILGLLYASKCLDSALWSPLPHTDQQVILNKAINFLEKYIKLTKAKKNQRVILRAYLTLSELFELQNSYKQSLEYLSKAVEQIGFAGDIDVPVEILNNLGCFHFINGDLGEAIKLFEVAGNTKEKNQSGNSFLITVEYNTARVLESSEAKTSEDIYRKILSAHPEYVYAKVRLLYLKFTSANSKELSQEISNLIARHGSNLEVRSFYSWYLKHSADPKTNEKGENLETNHNRDTLLKFNSHDSYALISLANLYITIARDNKKSSSPKDQEKCKQSFIKAIQLFQKVLQLDPYNIFAAQGLAIVFAENKRLGPSLEIFRKVRDSLDEEAVHINLGHCLLEMHEYSKAIENYDIALKRFDREGNKSHILNLLGKAWYLRGVKEKSLECFKKSLIYAKQSMELECNKERSKMLDAVTFNVALLEFQVAETLRRSLPKTRTLQDLRKAASGLDSALDLLRGLIDRKTGIVPIEELEQRLQLGETTMKSALERCIQEQKDYESEAAEKLEKARKLMEETEQKELQQLKLLEEQERAKKQKQAEEFRKLQEEARKLMEERAEMDNLINEKDENGMLSGDDDVNEDAAEKPKKKKKRAKRVKKDQDDDAPKRRKRSKKPVIGDDDEDNSDSNEVPPLSKEFIDDSDEEIGEGPKSMSGGDGEASAVATPKNSDGENDLF